MCQAIAWGTDTPATQHNTLFFAGPPPGNTGGGIICPTPPPPKAYPPSPPPPLCTQIKCKCALVRGLRSEGRMPRTVRAGRWTRGPPVQIPSHAAQDITNPKWPVQCTLLGFIVEWTERRAPSICGRVLVACQCVSAGAHPPGKIRVSVQNPLTTRPSFGDVCTGMHRPWPHGARSGDRQLALTKCGRPPTSPGDRVYPKTCNYCIRLYPML